MKKPNSKEATITMGDDGIVYKKLLSDEVQEEFDTVSDRIDNLNKKVDRMYAYLRAREKYEQRKIKPILEYIDKQKEVGNE